MAIRRYVADADNTITNAFESDLTTRGTGSNMGAADSLEVFSLYGQTSASSGLTSELSRILIKFPVNNIIVDRAASTIPASGSVSFYLKMYNAEHPFTLARDFKLLVSPVSSSWEEGHGLDMEEYKDITYDSTGSNWPSRVGTAVAATATVTWYAGDRPEAGDTITIIDAAGVSKAYIAAASQDLTSDPPKWHASNTTTTQVDSLQSCIESAQGHNGSIIVSQDATGLIMTLTSSTTGTPGNTTITVAGATSGQISATNFSSGSSYTPWATAGGDYLTAQRNLLTASFPSGWEDLELDISTIVEDWIIGSSGGKYENYGLGIRLTSSQETSGQSYYTKKFFARSTEFFFKRPVIEARWDSRTKDDRGNFYYSSSLAPGPENLNTLYFYNYVRGRLVNVPSVGAGRILVSLYSGSSSPAGSKLTLYNSKTNITGGYVSTGIYSASVGITASSPPLTKLFDVWHSASSPATATITITDYTELNTGDKVNLIATDGTDYDFTNGDQSSVNGTWESATSNTATATNLMNVINTTSGPAGTRFTATSDGAVVTAAQAYAGVSGNTTVTLTDGGTAGMSKTNFAGDLGSTEYVTSSLAPLTLTAYNHAPTFEYVTAITNLKSEYSRQEDARLRLFVREKDWNPNIYSVATSTVPNKTIVSASYKVARMTDDLDVITYGTGSDKYTYLSYDISGNYFDLDVNLLEAGYAYGVRFSYYNHSIKSWVEQPETFKFRVEE